MNVEDALRDYSRLQEALCLAVAQRYPGTDSEFLTHIPSHGTINVNNSTWDFRKHGAGLRFIKFPANEIVDAHLRVLVSPHAMDSWRLLQYFESKGVDSLERGSVHYSVRHQRSIEQMLKILCTEGFLSSLDEKQSLYTLTLPSAS